VNQPRNRFLSLLESTGDRPAIIAHRGDSFHAPENTLDAARLAWKAGTQAWELDVQLTRDGIPIVIHDGSLTRTTDVAARFADDPRGHDGFRVSDFDYEELRNLDAGSWFVDKMGGPRSARAFGTLDHLEPSWIDHCRSGSVIIPTLAEALTLTAELDWLVNIEIKSFPEQPSGLLDSVLDLVKETRTADRVLISSFDHRDVEEAFGVGREYALGILVETPLYRLHDYASRVDADTVNVSAEYLGSQSIAYRRHPGSSSLAGRVVEGLKDRGFPTLVYTVNDHRPGGLSQHLAEIGVNGLFTDDPSGLRHYFEAVSERTPGEPR
jgi:glycerophosphoryl diester phosphodiesterase